MEEVIQDKVMTCMVRYNPSYHGPVITVQLSRSPKLDFVKHVTCIVMQFASQERMILVS